VRRKHDASPSARSSNGLNVPSEPNVPRTLWITTSQATLGQQAPVQEPEELTTPVARTDQHGRLRPLTRRFGHPTIGQQHRAVVHRKAEVALPKNGTGAPARQRPTGGRGSG
jgi:hypothetical protein